MFAGLWGPDFPTQTPSSGGVSGKTPGGSGTGSMVLRTSSSAWHFGLPTSPRSPEIHLLSDHPRAGVGVLKPPSATPQQATHPPPALQEPGGHTEPSLSCPLLASLSNRATFKFCSASAAVCWAVSPREDFCPETGLARTPPWAGGARWAPPGQGSTPSWCLGPGGMQRHERGG